MKATESLLREKGYDGFSFSALALRIGVGRSTLYDHFSSKEELIVACMTDVMEKMMVECEQLSQCEDACSQIKGMVRTFHTYSQIHQLVQSMPALKKASARSERIAEALEQLAKDHHRLMELLTNAFEKAKEQGSVRQDAPTSLLASMVFHSILLPNVENLSEERWSELIFDLLYQGIQRHESDLD